MKWALTIIRNGEQGDTEKISHAEFRFGRKTGELDDSTAMRLPSGLIELPEKISLKVSELPLRTTAWAVENGILEGPDGEQMTLHQWTELPEQEAPDDLEELPMPGPSTSSYEFL